jgi:biopolymer transport protein ExbD
MSIEFVCETCGTSKRVNDRFAGRRVRCPTCDAVIRIPDAPQTEAIVPEVMQSQATSPQIIVAAPDGALIANENLISDNDNPVTAAAEAAPIVIEAQPAVVVPVVSVARPTKAAVARAVASPAPSHEREEDEEDQGLPKADRPETEMDMTPMVDVTFLLLIFFMVTAAFSLQKSIQMPRQQTDAPSTASSVTEEQTETVDVEVDQNGSFLVLAPDFERETPGKQNLISALREANAGKSEPMKLNVKVHEQAKVRAMVDAMDAGTIANYSPILVVQVDGFD